jgi:hypothetical protein
MTFFVFLRVLFVGVVSFDGALFVQYTLSNLQSFDIESDGVTESQERSRVTSSRASHLIEEMVRISHCSFFFLIKSPQRQQQQEESWAS